MAQKRNKSLFGTLRKIGIVAPASPCDKKKLVAGIEILKQNGIEVLAGENLFRTCRFSYLSADDSCRAADLNKMTADSSIDAILCTRGGYGTPRILELIDYNLLRERNLPIIGFSDITALHLAMSARNAGVGIASQMTARLPEAIHSRSTVAGMKRVYSLLSNPAGTFRKLGRTLRCLNRNKSVSGQILPLNLTLTASLCGTDFLPGTDGKIVILEEIGEPVRKIDKMLHQLYYSGFFRGTAAVIFAQFTDCGNRNEQTLLFNDFAEQIQCPVFTGLNFGHELPSFSFLFGEDCLIEEGNLSVRG